MIHYDYAISLLDLLPSNFPQKYVDEIKKLLVEYQAPEEETESGPMLDIDADGFKLVIESVVEKARAARNVRIKQMLEHRWDEIKGLLAGGRGKEKREKELSEEEKQFWSKNFPNLKEEDIETPETPKELTIDEAVELFAKDEETRRKVKEALGNKGEDNMSEETDLKIEAGYHLFDQFDTAGSSWELEEKQFKRKTTEEEDIEKAVREGGLWSYEEGDEVLISNGAETVPVKICSRLEGMRYKVANQYGEESEIEEDEVIGDSYNVF